MRLILYISILCLVGCSAAPKTYPAKTQSVITSAQKDGFTLKRYPTQTFLISTFENTPQAVPTLHIYIEGDGHSWKTRYQLSDNPTPHQPLALKLAMQDRHDGVIYIARPCQYTPLQLDKHCNPKYWSSHRYATEVIDSINETLDQIKASKKNTNFMLIGFSGGASVAALVAAQRKDVVGLISVAGDLNHELLNKHHKTSPLTGSLNPSQFAHKLKDLPQHHYSGDKDTIVPPWLAQHYAKELNNPRCVKVSTLKGVSHHKGWEQQWSKIVQLSPTCDH
ncbi:MAG: hypothetical protein AB7V32_09440 [Candidatus Berkiella sp.]